MRLISLSYKNTNWELKNLKLDTINLIVGKNAVGKSRTLLTIDLLYKLLTQKLALNKNETWYFELLNSNNQVINYQFQTAEFSNKILHEKIQINGKLVLERTEEETKIKSYTSNSWENIYPPKDKLTLHVRRDTKAYPYLENIINWAENSRGFRFGSLTPQNAFIRENESLLMQSDNDSLLSFYLENIDKQIVIQELQQIDFPIIDLLTTEDTKYPKIIIQEKDTGFYDYSYLSQGMFRALFLIILFEYFIKNETPTTIVIDDLCEGLDYNRATKLGRLIFEKSKNSNVQLIATSNDDFLMDVVDLKYWNVLQRNGYVVTAINNQTHEALFKKFKFTGLSNFDFFASDYIEQTI